MEDSKLLIRLLNEIRSGQQKLSDNFSELDKKMDLHVQKTNFELSSLSEKQGIHNELLAQHAQRSEELKRENDLREKRINKEIETLNLRISTLEAPRKSLKQLKGWIIGAAAVLVAAREIWQFFH